MSDFMGPMAVLEDLLARDALHPQPPPLVDVPLGYEYTADDRRAMNGYSLDDGTAIVLLVGVVRSADDWGTSWSRVIKALKAAKADTEVRRLLLWIDTPGGAVGGITQAVEEIRRFGKPTVAYVAGVCASAGYWVASACQSIVCAPEAAVGGVGAVIIASKEDNTWAVRFTSKRTPRKNAAPTSEAGKEDRQRLVDSLGDLFLRAVAENRGIKGDLDAVAAALGEGALLPAEDALALKMIDRIETMASPRRNRFLGVSGFMAHAGDERRGGPMKDDTQADPRVAALEAELASLRTDRDGKAALAEQLEARLKDQGSAIRDLTEKVQAMHAETQAQATARVAAEAAALKLEAERAVDAMVTDGFPEARREGAVQAFIQHKAGNSAWWNDIQASHTPGGASHLRGRETTGAKPPRIGGQVDERTATYAAKFGLDEAAAAAQIAEDDKVREYANEKKISITDARKALGLG